MRVFNNPSEYFKIVMVLTGVLVVLKCIGILNMSWYEATVLIWAPILIAVALLVAFVVILGSTLGVLYIQAKYFTKE
jgi:hypothetical protein